MEIWSWVEEGKAKTRSLGQKREGEGAGRVLNLSESLRRLIYFSDIGSKRHSKEQALMESLSSQFAGGRSEVMRQSPNVIHSLQSSGRM